jgi:hypothetical protein
MNPQVPEPVQARRSRRNAITLALLLLWVAAVFTYSILKFAKVIN